MEAEIRVDVSQVLSRTFRGVSGGLVFLLGDRVSEGRYGGCKKYQRRVADK